MDTNRDTRDTGTGYATCAQCTKDVRDTHKDTWIRTRIRAYAVAFLVAPRVRLAGEASDITSVALRLAAGALGLAAGALAAGALAAGALVAGALAAVALGLAASGLGALGLAALGLASATFFSAAFLASALLASALASLATLACVPQASYSRY